MIILYRFLSILLSPLIDLYLLVRKSNLKEDKIRFRERLGFATLKRPDGFLLWVHTASVGESNSISPLIDYLLKKYLKINILLTSGTVTSAQQIAKNLPARVMHQFVPVDKYYAVKRFIKHWQPDFALFVESEIWPNLITQTQKSGCHLALVNGRISQASYQRWMFLHKIGFNILQNFTLSFAQSKKDKIFFQKLGLNNVHFFGNLKSVCSLPKISQKELNHLKKTIGTRNFWLAASTHQGEEEIIIKTHQRLKKCLPDILTIIVPRHPVRRQEILLLIPQELKFAIRSKKENINIDTDIYLADTMGELGLFYKLSKFALIGGSLIDNIGGHNPFEAIKSDCLPISGSYTDNFKEVYQQLEYDNICLIANNQKELFAYLLKLIENKKYYLLLLKNASNLTKDGNKILERITLKLDSYIGHFLKDK